MKFTLSVLSLVFILFVTVPKLNSSKTNIKYDAMLPTAYKDGLIFSALASEDDSFYKLYFSKIIDKETLSAPELIKLKKNEKYWNVSNLVYLPIANEFYFTANNKTGSLSIYTCEMKNLELINPKRLKLTKNKINVAFSTFSEDGLNLIVSSGFQGNIESNLMLYTRKTNTSDWEFKRELTEINTTDLELHPILKNDSTLYFTRRNKKTGSMYVYCSKSQNNTWQKPKKVKLLDKELNTFGIVFTDKQSGYFTATEHGHDRIFYFENAL